MFWNGKLGEPDKSKGENGILGIKKVGSWMMEDLYVLKLPASSFNSFTTPFRRQSEFRFLS